MYLGLKIWWVYGENVSAYLDENGMDLGLKMCVYRQNHGGLWSMRIRVN